MQFWTVLIRGSLAPIAWCDRTPGRAIDRHIALVDLHAVQGDITYEPNLKAGSLRIIDASVYYRKGVN